MKLYYVDFFRKYVLLVFWRVNDQLDVLNCPFIVRVCVNSGEEKDFSLL